MQTILTDSGRHRRVLAMADDPARVPALVERGNPEYDEARTRWYGVRRQIGVVRLRRRTDTELAPQPHVPTTPAGSV